MHAYHLGFSKTFINYKDNPQTLIDYLLGFCPWGVASVKLQYQMSVTSRVA